MIKQLTKLSRLHKNDWRAIRMLIDLCATHDKYKIKVYWHIIQDRLTMEFNDFMYYLDGNLVGYLGLFTFNSSEAELTAVVHPKYRKQGIFKKMFTAALQEMKQRYISNCIWICPRGSFINADFMQNLWGKYLYSQVEMKAMHPPVSKELPEIRLRLASTDDLLLLSQMGSTSFNSSFTETLQRFTENLREKNRKAWLASTPTHENVGKIHVRYEDNNTGFIHDLCILPEYRGQNLATSMILKTMQLLRETGHRNIVLDVECHNKGALRLYEQCGFETIGAHDYWTVAVERMLQIWG